MSEYFYFKIINEICACFVYPHRVLAHINTHTYHGLGPKENKEASLSKLTHFNDALNKLYIKSDSLVFY